MNCKWFILFDISLQIYHVPNGDDYSRYVVATSATVIIVLSSTDVWMNQSSFITNAGMIQIMFIPAPLPMRLSHIHCD